MDFISKKSWTKCLCGRWNPIFVMVLSAGLLLSLTKVSPAAENESVGYYKMISTVEYSGEGQLRNQVETLFTVKKQCMANDKVRYCVSSDDLNGTAKGTFSFQKLSFDIDRKTQHLSGASEDLAFWGKVSNECTKSLKKTTKANVGKTWKQSLDLSSLGSTLPSELNFTLTAMQVKAGTAGEMIAVRALSEPFIVKVGSTGAVNSRINTVYLFDTKIEDIYLGISVFEAETNINGSKETLRYEVAAYKTDARGVPADLSGLGENFENFVSKIGLKSKSLEVSKSSPLPEWAKSESLPAAQAANICSATVCEGALNPVASLAIPAAKVVDFQKNANDELLIANASLGAGKSGSRNIFQQIGDNWGWNLPTAAVVGVATVGAIAIGGGFGGGGGGSHAAASN